MCKIYEQKMKHPLKLLCNFLEFTRVYGIQNDPLKLLVFVAEMVKKWFTIARIFEALWFYCQTSVCSPIINTILVVDIILLWSQEEEQDEWCKYSSEKSLAQVWIFVDR